MSELAETKTELQKFIERRQSILDGIDPFHPDHKHHYSFLKLAQAVQKDLSAPKVSIEDA